MDYKKELLYLVKSLILVIVLNGLLSTFVIMMLTEGKLPEQGDAMAVLGEHIFWIIPLSLTLTAYLLHQAMPKIAPKPFIIQLGKVTLYFALATLIENLLR